jgi:hypothetical protein
MTTLGRGEGTLSVAASGKSRTRVRSTWKRLFWCKDLVESKRENVG